VDGQDGAEGQDRRTSRDSGQRQEEKQAPSVTDAAADLQTHVKQVPVQASLATNTGLTQGSDCVNDRLVLWSSVRESTVPKQIFRKEACKHDQKQDVNKHMQHVFTVEGLECEGTAKKVNTVRSLFVDATRTSIKM
jgi:hypothetical protein